MASIKRGPFISNPQLFMDYYTKQAGVGDVQFSGLGNQFGSLQSRVIPLKKSENNTDFQKQPTVIVSPTQAAAEQARAQIKRQRLLEKEISAPKRQTKKKPKTKRKTAAKKKTAAKNSKKKTAVNKKTAAKKRKSQKKTATKKKSANRRKPFRELPFRDIFSS